MKITNFIKEDLLARLEEIAKKIGKTADSLRQDPSAFLKELKSNPSSLIAIFSPLFKKGESSIQPQVLRNRIKKQVKKNLVGRYHDEQIVDAITELLMNTAKEDPHYRRLLGLEKKVA